VYDIGGNYFGLADIYHGVLLAPLPPPDLPFGALARLTLPSLKLADDDARADCRIEVPEPFLLFCLAPGAVSGARYTVFRPAVLQEQIHAEAANYIRRHVTIAPVHRRVTLPGLLQWHRAAFGATWREMLAYLVNRLPETELAHYVDAVVRGGAVRSLPTPPRAREMPRHSP
jgi:hypothetical protein